MVLTPARAGVATVNVMFHASDQAWVIKMKVGAK
jgi:hypothetical protein